MTDAPVAEASHSDALSEASATTDTDVTVSELLVEEVSIDGMCGVY